MRTERLALTDPNLVRADDAEAAARELLVLGRNLTALAVLWVAFLIRKVPWSSEPIELNAVGAGSSGSASSGVNDHADVRDSAGACATGGGNSVFGETHCAHQIAPTIRNASICSSL